MKCQPLLLHLLRRLTAILLIRVFTRNSIRIGAGSRAKRGALPTQTPQETGPDHQKKFRVEVEIRGKVMGKGSGLSKKKAEMMAARLAWKKIGTTEGPAQKKMMTSGGSSC